MQTLIGNVFGFKFRSLDAKIDKLNKMQNDSSEHSKKDIPTTSHTISTNPDEDA